MGPITAVFENGVFRPVKPVDLPEKSKVEFELRLIDKSEDPEHLKRVAEILSRRYSTDCVDGAERHNEHQP